MLEAANSGHLIITDKNRANDILAGVGVYSPERTKIISSAVDNISQVSKQSQWENANSAKRESLDTVARFEIKGRENKNTATQAADEAYSIKRDINGEKYVEVEDDILDTNDGRSYAQIISDVIKNKFNGLVSANGQNIVLTKKNTVNEWTRSKTASSLLNNDKNTYEDKIRAFDNVDEILSEANGWIAEQARHHNFKEFARGKIYFKVGNNGYSADVVVGINTNNIAILYDLVNITPKKIIETPNPIQGKSQVRRHGASVQSQNTTPSAKSQGENVNSAKRESLDYKRKIQRCNGLFLQSDINKQRLCITLCYNSINKRGFYMDDDLKIVGERLKALRTERDLTMDMVVNDMNTQYSIEIRRGNLSKWERGVNIPSLYMAKFLCMYYRVSLDYLLGLTDNRAPVELLAKSKKGVKK